MVVFSLALYTKLWQGRCLIHIGREGVGRPGDMYTTCAFCSGPLGGDGGPSGLGVGRKLAYDGWKSRAWVICAKCARWNLTPFDTRLDIIAALDRMAGAGRVAASSDQVALIRFGPYDIVRVGRPPRVEMAGWRYGERIKARERERLKVVVPVTVAAIGVAILVDVAAGGGVGFMVGQLPNIGDSVYTELVGNRKIAVEPPVCATCGNIMLLKAKHVRHARISRTTHHDLSLLLSCPRCRSLGAELAGSDAELALRAGLTYVNLKRRKRIKKKAEGAALYLERHGGPETFIVNTARLEKPIAALHGEEALALEMAVDEQAELKELEREWRKAEEIAAIADGLLVSPGVEAKLKELKAKDQPPG
ncbi:MAG: hypothetical protein HY705_09620 [Gemmatimonadetes bacterium]|nr:hypothetical protein [Gemmatimonadota bacterium]